MKFAAAKYRVGAPATWDGFADGVARRLEAAAAAGVRLAVLPEYLALELGHLLPPAQRGDLGHSLRALQPLLPQWHALFSTLAQRLRLEIVAGSFLEAVAGERYRNRSTWYSPDGRRFVQEKLQLTGFERATGLIEAGEGLAVRTVDGVRAGIAVCYDVEFPLPVRAQREAGARLLLVPSCTDTAAGARRVEVGCLARALENRMFVVRAVTAGAAPWSPALDANTGEAAIHAPMDRGLPADGVLAQTRDDQDWAVAELDFAALDDASSQPQVANDRDWPGQWRPGSLRARVEG